MTDINPLVWCSVYIVECSDGTLYTGMTRRLPEERVKEHNSGKGAKYTRGRGPVKLLVSVKVVDVSSALRLERLVKKQSKKNKVKFLTEFDINSLYRKEE